MRDEDVTQKDVDEMFGEVREAWKLGVLNSGVSEAMFIATDRTGFVSLMLGEYQEAKELVEAKGLVMPELVKGIEIKVS